MPLAKDVHPTTHILTHPKLTVMTNLKAQIKIWRWCGWQLGFPPITLPIDEVLLLQH